MCFIELQMATGIQVHRVITYKDCFVFLVMETKADGVVCGGPLVCQVTFYTIRTFVKEKNRK